MVRFAAPSVNFFLRSMNRFFLFSSKSETPSGQRLALQKPVGGAKPRPTKVAKSPSSIQDIEIEVAEVLYGLTRQFQDPSNKQDLKDMNGCGKDQKSRVLSPSSASAAPAMPKSSVLPPQNSSVSTSPLPAVGRSPFQSQYALFP